MTSIYADILTNNKIAEMDTLKTDMTQAKTDIETLQSSNSNWSETAATQSVDAGGYDITNAHYINTERVIVGGISFFNSNGTLLSYAPMSSIGHLTGGSLGTEGEIYTNGNNALFCNSTLKVQADTNLISSGSNASITGINNITCGAITPNVINLGGTGGVRLVPEDTQMTVYGSAYYTGEIISNEGISAPTLYTNLALLGTNDNYITSTLAVDGALNEIRSERNASITGINEITCNKLNYTTLSPAIGFRPQNTYYVSKNGTDAVGGGGLLNPFATIQYAITTSEAVWDGSGTEIIISFGSYVENLTITKPRIQLTGQSPSRYVNTMSSITGNIRILCNSGNIIDLFNNQIMFIGLQIVGNSTGGRVDFSQGAHTLVIKDCYLYRRSSMLVVNPDNSAGVHDFRLYLENNTFQTPPYDAVITSGTLVLIGYGNCIINNNIFTTANKTSLLTFTGNAGITSFTNNQLKTDLAGTALPPMIEYNSSITSFVIGQNAFIQSNGTTKTTVNSGGVNYFILVANGLNDNKITVINNTFDGVGTSGDVVGYQSAGGSSGSIFYNNNTQSGGCTLEGTFGVSKFLLEQLV